MDNKLAILFGRALKIQEKYNSLVSQLGMKGLDFIIATSGKSSVKQFNSSLLNSKYKPKPQIGFYSSVDMTNPNSSLMFARGKERKQSNFSSTNSSVQRLENPKRFKGIKDKSEPYMSDSEVREGSPQVEKQLDNSGSIHAIQEKLNRRRSASRTRKLMEHK